MIKNITRLEYKAGDRVYHFLCECDSPTGEVHDALSAFKSKVVEIMNKAEQDEAEAKKAKDKVKDVETEEV